MTAELRLGDLDFLFPTPLHRINNPLPAPIERNAIVYALDGIARGRLGIVVIERNGNYHDMSFRHTPEAIGVRFADKWDWDESVAVIKDYLEMGDSHRLAITVWFDRPEQLEVVKNN